MFRIDLRLSALLLSSLLFAAPLAAQEVLFDDSFETADIPKSDAEAARFLTQATFGPTKADIAFVRANGVDAWLEEQIGRPQTLHRPYLDGLSAQGLGVGQSQRMDRWFHVAATAPDQLRQRVAFALSQIFVVSDVQLGGEWAGVSQYYDLLATHAFGNYRSLLGEITRNPMMGRYLSHWRNRKASATTEPDENYAREVMQLFSIGLVWRNLDYTPIVDGMGEPVPTYDQGVITELAQVFTGYADPCPAPPTSCNPYSSISSGVLNNTSMACFPRFHDTSTKVLFDRDPGPALDVLTLPAGPVCDPEPADGTPLEQSCYAYCTSDLDAALDALAAHPNVAPFLSRQMIQRLTTSNPSPAYVQRVATAFRDGGGSLRAMVKAILADPEARAFDPLAPGQGVPAGFGKQREPLLRLTAVWRAFAVQPGICPANASGCSAVTETRMGVRNPESAYLQRPLGAPTVFNFYEPDYRQPGPIADAGLYSPEFQIINETSVATVANELWTRTWSGYSTSTGTFTLPTTSAYLSSAEIDALPNDDGALVDELNLRLMYGSMSGSYTPGSCVGGSGMKGVLHNLLRCQMVGLDKRRKVLGAIHLIAISPEYSLQH